MPAGVQELLVFIASPGDVPDEREAVRQAVEAANASVGRKFAIRLQASGWETVQPDAGRPQEQINPLVDECDVFIGILNRRWGSPTGTHTSGFEEEFQRALARRTTEGVPRIGMFFNKVPSDVLSDPGAELRKVLDFKRQLREEYVVLYQQFDGPHDFGRILMAFLTDIVAELAAKQVTRSPEGTESAVPSTVPNPADSIDSARGQLLTVFSRFYALMQGREHDDPLDSDRLFLIGAAIHKNEQLIPGHTTNRLYLRREELSLVVAEYQLWLRTLLNDIAHAASTGWSRTIPAWHVLTTGQDTDLEQFGNEIAGFVTDENRSVAQGAFTVLTHLHLRPSSLWELAGAKSTDSTETLVAQIGESTSPIDQWHGILDTNNPIQAAFAYIVESATLGDSALLNSVIDRLTNADSTAQLTAIKAHLEGQRDRLASLAANEYSVPAWREEILIGNISTLSDDALSKLVTGRHKSKALRLAAFVEVADRGRLTVETFRVALKSDDRKLEDAAFASAGVDSELIVSASADLSSDSLDTRLAARVLAATVSSEELQAQLPNTFKGVEIWEALAWQDAASHAAEARKILDTDAEELTVSLGELTVPGESSEAIERIRKYMRLTARRGALEVLARLPEKLRESGDSQRFRVELARAHWLTRTDAAFGLIDFGTLEDVPTLLSVGADIYPTDHRAEFLDGVVKLGGKDTARALTKSEDSLRVLVGTRYLAEIPDIPDAELVDLLYSEHPPVRLAALTGLRERWGREQLAVLLNTYPQARDYYYYNVMAELDRILHAPTSIAELPITIPLA